LPPLQSPSSSSPPKAGLYYPSRVERLYQMSQTIASHHLLETCNHIAKDIRDDLTRLRGTKSAALGRRRCWADAGRALGLIEYDKRLFYDHFKGC